MRHISWPRLGSRLISLLAVLTLSVLTIPNSVPRTRILSDHPRRSSPLAATHRVMDKAVSENLGTIMARDRLAGPQQAPAAPARRSQPKRASRPPNRILSKVSARPDPQPALRAGLPSVARTTGPLLGAQVSESGSVPPDSMGAVRPTQFIVIVNGRIKSFNKTTGVVDGVLNSSTDAFFAAVTVVRPPTASALRKPSWTADGSSP